MASDCELAITSHIDVEVFGATVVVRATDVLSRPGWKGRIELVSEGPPVRIRVVVCRDPSGGFQPSGSVIRASFALPAPPQLVIVEHAQGQTTFEFAVRQAEASEGSIRGEGPPSPPVMRSIDDVEASAAAPPREPAPVGSAAEASDDGLTESGADVSDADSAVETGEPEAPGFYGRIDAPEKFVVSVPAEVTIGIAGASDPKVIGTRIELPESLGQEFILTVQLVADGFDLVDGDARWRHDLAVTKLQPHPVTRIQIRAGPVEGELEIRRLRVLYSVEGQVIGIAERPVAVVAEGGTQVSPPRVDSAARAAMAVPVSEEPADLTIVILHDPVGERGHLLWAFSSPHGNIGIPSTDLTTDVGLSPEAFAQRLRAEVEAAEATEGQPVLRETLRGIARKVTAEMPEQIWPIIRNVAERRGVAPSVLLLSQEPYVPWELAEMPTPIDPALPPFLGAQTVIGRWVFGQEKPKMPPPAEVAMGTMAVVYGDYHNARLAKLVEAEEERTSLEHDYPALPIRATLPAVVELLRGHPSAEVMHFAIHGRFQGTQGAGLLMEDGAALSSLAVTGTDLGAGPFVFLNACQVGAGEEMLGDYSGMAEAFLRAGASAVVAPLWSVRDGVAKDVALRFYPGALTEGASPAELLRRERARFAAAGDPATATHLAYLFYGHPAFHLTRAT
jgi:hypothetical protein